MILSSFNKSGVELKDVSIEYVNISMTLESIWLCSIPHSSLFKQDFFKDREFELAEKFAANGLPL